MNKMTVLGLLLPLLCLSRGGVAEGSFAVAIPNIYVHAEDLGTDGDWSGIVASGEGFSLVPTEVTVKPFPYYDGNSEKDMVGVSVSVEGGMKPLVLVRGLQNTKARTLIAKPQTQVFLFPGQSIEVTEGKRQLQQRFFVTASGGAEQYKGQTSIRYRDYELRLSHGTQPNVREQVLMSLPEFSSFDSPQIIWAGDLDNDGKPDFIVNRQRIYFQTDLALFLSSAAKEDELVGLVAEWKAMQGC